MSLKIPRKVFIDLFGPTTGDRVRLADQYDVQVAIHYFLF